MMTIDEAKRQFEILEKTHSTKYKGKLSWDEEAAHQDADNILCNILKSLGYGEIVDIYEAIPKWYA